MTRSLLPLALALLLAACGGGGTQREDAPLRVSAIGGPAKPGDPSAGALDTPTRLLMDATAQGLVRFDAAGQIEPGLAERWIVIDDGRSYIFRLREAEWPDHTPVTTEQVVRVLKRAAAANSGNALAPFLKVIDEIVAMTDRVVEVRLNRPRPDLLKLFAQPELAIFRLADRDGSGPFRVQADKGEGVLLRPARDLALTSGDDDDEPKPHELIRLRGDDAALAISRFKDGKADAVLGGSFADWPIVGVAGIAPESIRIDPALGLFGFAVVSRDGFLADAANRAALAMAVDRDALTQSIHPGWAPVETVLPAQLDSAGAPATPAWGPLPLAARRENGRARVLAWHRAHPEPLAIRVALPPGQGSTLVWGAMARALVAIGIRPVRVGMDDDADIRLVDAVAPYDSGRWFLATACELCADDVSLLIDAARDAPDLTARAHRIAEADAALTADSAYIPIAQPFRWSIVTIAITGWQGNTRAWHPLNHLRNETE